MSAPSWPSADPAPKPQRRQVPGWAKAAAVGLVAFVVGAGTGGGDTEPPVAETAQVTETETERVTERATVVEAAPTITEAAPTVTVTEAAPAVAAAPQPFVEPAPAPAPAPAPPPSSVYYENCDAARAAGAAPLSAGDPGYRAGLDRDADGSACE